MALTGTTAADKAKILAEALPYIQRFHGKTIVVKYGGNAMTDDALKEGFARDVVLLKLVGMNPVVVHGGGPQIDDLLKQLGKKGEFVQGMRVTDAETMDVVEMVLGGQVNKEIVNLINQHGGKAVGLTGKDGGLIRARRCCCAARTIPTSWSTSARWARSTASTRRSCTLLDTQRLHPGDRADRRRARTARPTTSTPTWWPASSPRCCKAEKLVVLTNTPGVLDKNGKLLTGLTPKKIDDLFADGTISGGMLPKIGSALDAREERREERAHHRRPRRARAAAGGAHRRRRRHADQAAARSMLPQRARCAERRSSIGGVWIFDLTTRCTTRAPHIFPHINRAMTAYLQRTSASTRRRPAQLRQHYWQRYGATLLGLMRHHGTDPAAFPVAHAPVSRARAHGGARAAAARDAARACRGASSCFPMRRCITRRGAAARSASPICSTPCSPSSTRATGPSPTATGSCACAAHTTCSPDAVSWWRTSWTICAPPSGWA